MEKARYSCIVLVISLLLPALALSQEYEAELDLDYCLYKKHSVCAAHTAMDYVYDLNRRIEKCGLENNFHAFKYLTKLLTYVLVTGGPFGIRPTGPTADEWTILNVSFNFISKLAIVSSSDQTDDAIRSNLGQISSCTAPGNSDGGRLIQAQGVYHLALKALPTAKSGWLPTLQDHKVDAWVRFAADDKVIIRDPNKDREFYLLDTKGDGACWMYGMACSHADEFTGTGFIQKLLGLDPKRRGEVCNFALGFFSRTLTTDATLLKGIPEGLAEALALKPLLQKLNRSPSSLSDEERLKVLKFISREEVFKALVGRQGKDQHDTKSLVTSGKTVWNDFSDCITWARIWAFVYQVNIYSLDIHQVAKGSPLEIINKTFYQFSGRPWGLFYTGKHDCHTSALWPVGITPPPNGMAIATKKILQLLSYIAR